MGSSLRYKRAILKISGELLGGESGGLSSEILKKVADEICEVHALGAEIGIIVGGGNIIRGQQAEAIGIDRVTGDYMGMLATVINALALQNVIEQKGVQTRVLTAFEIRAVAEPYVRRRALRHLEKGRVVIFAGGTGNPYFSTDTAAALRANEINAEILLKGTKVDGVYTGDPEKDPTAQFIPELTFDRMLREKLAIMDSTAAAMLRDSKIPVVVFNLWQRGNIIKILKGERVGTLIRNEV